MTKEEAMSVRLCNQQLSIQRFYKAEEVVGWMVQAQDYR